MGYISTPKGTGVITVEILRNRLYQGMKKNQISFKRSHKRRHFIATLEELPQRIQRLEDIKQIERLRRTYGYYENKYIKENGKWLFAKLNWNNTFCSPFEDGWLNIPLMGWMPLPDADAPPIAFHPSSYHVNNMPYNYHHPVTGE